MEPLYTTTTQNSYEEYKRYSHCASKFTQTLITFILLSAFLIACGLYLKDYFIIAFAVIWPVAVLVSVEIARKRIFKTNKITANATMTYEFFDTFFTVAHNHGSVKIEYEKLYKAIETKTNFYLMIAKNQGYVLVKENFPEGLDAFLRSVAPSKKRGKHD